MRVRSPEKQSGNQTKSGLPHQNLGDTEADAGAATRYEGHLIPRKQ